MTARIWGAIARWGILTIVGGLGFLNIYTNAQAMTDTDYVLAGAWVNLTTQPQATVPVVVPVKNTSATPWDGTQLSLGTIYSTSDKNRPSIWKTADWQSDTRIGLTKPNRLIKPNQTAEFRFTMQAPASAGQYREYFQPILGETWLLGDPIVIQIQVGDGGVTIQETTPAKEVKIYRKSQTADWLEHGFVVATLPISSGKAGYTTPAGKYKIFNHIPDAYSSEYKLWMPNWMGLSSDKYGFSGYGMHSLPYWKVSPAKYVEGNIYPGGRLYTNGRLYEGYSHLGKAVSHGCVRFGISESAVLYSWAPNGTPVTVI